MPNSLSTLLTRARVGRRTGRSRDLQDRLLALDAGERHALLDLVRDDLARGRTPSGAEIDAALATIRA